MYEFFPRFIDAKDRIAKLLGTSSPIVQRRLLDVLDNLVHGNLNFVCDYLLGELNHRVDHEKYIRERCIKCDYQDMKADKYFGSGYLIGRSFKR